MGYQRGGKVGFWRDTVQRMVNPEPPRDRSKRKFAAWRLGLGGATRFKARARSGYSGEREGVWGLGSAESHPQQRLLTFALCLLTFCCGSAERRFRLNPNP